MVLFGLNVATSSICEIFIRQTSGMGAVKYLGTLPIQTEKQTFYQFIGAVLVLPVNFIHSTNSLNLF